MVALQYYYCGCESFHFVQKNALDGKRKHYDSRDGRLEPSKVFNRPEKSFRCIHKHPTQANSLDRFKPKLFGIHNSWWHVQGVWSWRAEYVRGIQTAWTWVFRDPASDPGTQSTLLSFLNLMTKTKRCKVAPSQSITCAHHLSSMSSTEKIPVCKESESPCDSVCVLTPTSSTCLHAVK